MFPKRVAGECLLWWAVRSPSQCWQWWIVVTACQHARTAYTASPNTQEENVQAAPGGETDQEISESEKKIKKQQGRI